MIPKLLPSGIPYFFWYMPFGILENEQMILFYSKSIILKSQGSFGGIQRKMPINKITIRKLRWLRGKGEWSKRAFFDWSKKIFLFVCGWSKKTLAIKELAFGLLILTIWVNYFGIPNLLSQQTTNDTIEMGGWNFEVLMEFN